MKRLNRCAAELGVAAVARRVLPALLTVLFLVACEAEPAASPRDGSPTPTVRHSDPRAAASPAGDSGRSVPAAAATAPVPAADTTPVGGARIATHVSPDVGRSTMEQGYTNCFPLQGLFPWAWEGFIEWGPNGGEVYFSQGPELYAVAADGLRVRKVAKAWTRVIRDPPIGSSQRVGTMIPFDVSATGSQIVYATCGYPQFDPARSRGESGSTGYTYELALARVDAAGGASKRLSADGEFSSHPSWSPDGRRLAFLHGTDSGFATGTATSLSTARSDGTDARAVVRASGDLRLALHAPAWSPDGRHLAFVAVGLHVVDADSAEALELRDLRPLTGAIESAPAWSPDGQRLAYAKVENDDQLTLYTIRADGTNERMITRLASWRSEPWLWRFGAIGSVAWSPDGSKILFVVNPHQWYEMPTATYVVGVADGDRVAIVWARPSGLQPRAAAWAPDGSRIAVLAEWDLAAFLNAGGRDSAPWPILPAALATMAPDGTDIRVLAMGVPNLGSGRATSVRVPPMGALGPLQFTTRVDPGACATTLVSFTASVVSQALARDCVTLLEIKRALRGGAALNWSVERPLDEWDGVRLDGDPLRVSELRLPGRQLGGTIPAWIGRLTQLRVLSLADNRLTGPIPAELGQLTKLETLHLFGNWLGGPVPEALGDLADLRYLALGENNLTGTLPEALGRLDGLMGLRIDETLISGPVPEFVGGLTQLRSLDLAGNRLTGSIPSVLGRLVNLEELDLSGNQLSGEIPAELGRLANLETLDLGDNRLSGEIPRELGQLADVREVRLYGNQLTGCIPADLRPVAYQQFTSLGLPRCAGA